MYMMLRLRFPPFLNLLDKFHHFCITFDVNFYGAPFREKLITFITPTLIFVRQQSIFRVAQNFFNQYNIYLYTTRTIFCQHAFLFCAALNTFSLSFGFHIIFLLPQHYLVNQISLERNATSM